MYRVMLVALLVLAVPFAGLATKAAAQEGEKDNAKKKDGAKEAPKVDASAKGADVITAPDGQKAQAVFLVNSPPIAWGQIAVAVLVLALLGLIMFQIMMLRSDMERLMKR